MNTSSGASTSVQTSTVASGNRLVFVSVKGKSVKRKVAVPITPSTTWEGFVETVGRKLKLQGGVGGMELASGEALHGLSQLEDIAEVLVCETSHGGGGVFVGGGASTTSVAVSPFSAAMDHRRDHQNNGVTANDGTNHGTNDESNDENNGKQFESKYIKKQSDVALALGRIQSVFGGGSQESLPLTKKDTMHLTPIEQVKRRMKKRRRSVFDPRTLLAVFSLLSVGVMMVFVYVRVSGSVIGAAGAAGAVPGRKVLPGGIAQ